MLRRYSPQEAHAALARGGILVDIRPAAQRAEEGEIPGALVIERNVLEWRFDPASEARLPIVVDHSLEVVVFCSEGYTSSLAAASLKELGFERATDMEGGFKAWSRAGYPTTGGPASSRGEAGSQAPVTLDPDTPLSIGELLEVAGGRPVELSARCETRVAAARQVVEETLASGTPAYGLNTGLGHARDQAIAAGDIAAYQRAIVLSHAGGIGPPLPVEVVRALLAARANSAVRGGSGLSVASVRLLVDLLNSGVHPVVPTYGSVGASDVMHLAAVAGVALGIGEAELKGRVLPAAEALAEAGLRPLELQPLEGLAWVSANSVAIALGALAVERARRVVETADLAVALSLEAVRGNLSTIDPAVADAKPVPGQREAIDHMRSLLSGSELFGAGAAASLQDPLSLRVAPQVHGAARDFVADARAAVELELNAMDDNPLVDHSGRRLVSNGNFHPIKMALAFEGLRPALAHVALCSVRRSGHLAERLFGEPARFEELVRDEDPRRLRAGSSYAAASIWAELRQLSSPATLDIQSLDFGQEDHATAAPLTVAVTGRVLELVERLLAVEMDCAASVLALLSPEPALGRGAAAAFRLLGREAAAFASAAGVNERLTALVARGDLLAAADAASG